jgi:chromosomal replication initiator protein
MISARDRESLAAVWAGAREALLKKISPDTYKYSFGCAAPLEIGEDSITVGVSDEFFADWLRDNYEDLLLEALEKVTGKTYNIVYEHGHFPENQEPAAEDREADETEESAPRAAAKPAKNCHSRNTFDNFVVGEENRYARAAAMAVAKTTAIYNPLYIYGSTGTGKTHLMQAVAHHVAVTKPGMTTEYVTCEEFLNLFVASLQGNRHYEFRNRFRKVDYLLIDDVHQLANKAQLQEEFFNTFNTLHNAGKQIILTSDKQPSQIKGLEERLMSRFESGVAAEITMPSVETRMAILKMKQNGHLIKFADDVLFFIASKISSSVRRLEGALLRLVAYSSAMGNAKIDTAKAETVLSKLLDEENFERAVSVDLIQKTVADHYGLRVTDITGSKRPKNIAEPRMIAMYLSRQLTDLSYPEIAQAFGKKNHATVIHAVKQISGECSADGAVKRAVSRLQKTLQT